MRTPESTGQRHGSAAEVGAAIAARKWLGPARSARPGRRTGERAPGRRQAAGETTIVDAVMPHYDVSDSVATVVGADAEATWRALDEADLLEVGRRHPLVAALGFARLLPEVAMRLLRGDGLPTEPRSMRLRDTADTPAAEGGWTLLGEEPGTELALGLVGKFWRPIIRYAHVEDAEDFRALSAPGWAKTVYSLRVTPIDEGRTLLTGTMRTATTDARSRRWFRRYWTLGVGSGAHVLVNGLLDDVRRQAEQAAATRSPDSVAVASRL